MPPFPSSVHSRLLESSATSARLDGPGLNGLPLAGAPVLVNSLTAVYCETQMLPLGSMASQFGWDRPLPV